jgi:hypothetical protein
MTRWILEDAAALVAISMFLAMIAAWAAIIEAL